MHHRTKVVLIGITCASALSACVGNGPLTEPEEQAMEALRHKPEDVPALCVIEREAKSGRVGSSQRSSQQNAMKWHMRTEHGSAGWETRRLHSAVLKQECSS